MGEKEKVLMNKQAIKLGSVAILLAVCVIGYFFISNYYENKEQEKENATKIVAFSLENYKDTKSISYTNDSETINLVQNDNKWHIKGKSKIDVDESIVETEMLSELVEVTADDKIDDSSNLADYGFTKKDGTITPSNNMITVVDAEDKAHTIYLGNANPYDASKYYIMVEGDDSVYVVDSSVADAFSKTADDLEKEEETTVEETAVNDTTTEG